MCSSLGMLSLPSPLGMGAAGLGAEILSVLLTGPRLAGSLSSPDQICQAPSLSSPGFCPVLSVIGPREGCGPADTLHRAWRQHPGLAGPPQDALPTTPGQAGSSASCPAEAGPGRAQWHALCDAPVAMVILDEKTIAFCHRNFHPCSQLCFACLRDGSVLVALRALALLWSASLLCIPHPSDLPLTPTETAALTGKPLPPSPQKLTSTGEVMVGRGKATVFKMRRPRFQPQPRLL